MQANTAVKVYTKVHLLVLAVLALLVTWAMVTHTAEGVNYGAGTYGTCQYNQCGITLASSGSISANVTPAGGTTKCTVNNDVVTVTTSSSTGYTVTVTNTDTNSSLVGPASIAASSGTPSSPVVLTANTWGYRVDGVASFGTGPTSAVSNGAVPSLTFAGVPSSAGTPGLIRTTNTADTGTVNTSVWYGVCASSSLQSGSYTDSVTYTAVIN